MNVLFVDDQKSVLDGISAGVNIKGLGLDNAFYATSATQAMEIIRSEVVNIVMSDIEMPEKDGIWLLHTIRSEYPEIITVMLTSHTDFRYAQEGVRMGCFDYLVQPTPPEEIEHVLKKALQYIYERNKHSQLYEIGLRMKTNKMELLDNVAMNLFSSNPDDIQAALNFLQLLGYPVTGEKEAHVLILTSQEFRRSIKPIATEKIIIKQILDAAKQAGLIYPVIAISVLNFDKQFVLLLFSATQATIELSQPQISCFFDILCRERPNDIIRCYSGHPAAFDNLREEYRRIRGNLSGKLEDNDILKLEYYAEHTSGISAKATAESDFRWAHLLESGQHRLLREEFEQNINRIQSFAPNRAKAMCDLHQKITHVFLNYFYDNNVNVNDLFQNQYSYDAYMNSYINEESLKAALSYMLKQVDQIEQAQAPESYIEKAKNFISENIANPVTVKDVAANVCLSAEYFTRLFKKETGQNIKDYIVSVKIEAAKDMLERSDIPIGMVALELGYTNFSHFSQVFRKRENMSPKDYRNMYLNK